MSVALLVDGATRAERGGSVALAWMGHLATIVALVVLVVNDHVLKASVPGLVTGKLSDLAGLVLAPPLLAVAATLLVPPLPSRVAAVLGVAGVGVGFVVVKATTSGAAAASAVWSAVALPSLIRADPTDLLTLPALLLAWWTFTRARRHPVAPRLVRLARVVVVLPAAVLAVAATSEYYPQAVAVAQWRGSIVVGEVDAAAVARDAHTSDGEPVTWHWARISDDGGRTWRRVDYDNGEYATILAEVERASAEQGEACASNRPMVCFRVVRGHLRVEESHDGGVTWRTGWEVSDEDRDRLAASFYELGDPAENLSSHALLVHPVGGAGYVVVVANGRDGFALRDVAGQWRRIGFGMAGAEAVSLDDPATDDGNRAMLWWQFSVLGTALLMIAVARGPGRRRWWSRLPLVVVGLGLAAQYAMDGGRGGGDYIPVLLAIGLTVAGATAWFVATFASRVFTNRQSLALVPAGLTAFFVSIPLTDHEGQSGGAAAAITVWVIGTTVTVIVTWLVGRPDTQRSSH